MNNGKTRPVFSFLKGHASTQASALARVDDWESAHALTAIRARGRDLSADSCAHGVISTAVADISNFTIVVLLALEVWQDAGVGSMPLCEANAILAAKS